MKEHAGMTILIISERADLSDALSRRLQAHGHTVLCIRSHDGIEGISAASGSGLAFVIVPGGGAGRAAQTAQGLRRRCDLPFLFVVENAADRDALKDASEYGCVTPGCDDIMLSSAMECAIGLHKACGSSGMSGELYRVHFELSSDVLYVLEPDLRVRHVTPNVARLLGYTPSEIIGKQFTDLNVLAETSLFAAFQDIQQVLAGQRVDANIYEFIMKNGEHRFGEVSGVPLVRNGAVEAIISIARDITERKLYEERISSLLEEKEMLLREVHHRIKNNMSILASLLSLQAVRLNNPGAEMALNEARSRVLLMMGIYNRLYRSEDFRHIRIGDYMTDLIGELKKIFMMRIEIVNMELDLDDILITSNISIPLGIMLTELITNAIKYAFPDGHGGTIRISARRPGEGTMTVTVADNGCGLPQNIDINEPSGFGLTLVNAMVKQLKGTLEVKRGRGTEFRITIPVG